MDKRIVTAVVLVLVLAGLGWYVGMNRPASVTQNPPAPAPGTQPGDGGNPASGLTEEERRALQPPAETATEAEKVAYLELVDLTAQLGDLVTTASCNLTPAVLKARSDKPFVFRNTGDEPVTISSGWVNAEIEPGGEHSVTLRGGGLYGYGCNSESGGMAGLVQLIN